MESEDATANRMHVEAAENATSSVQEIVDELAETHEGEPPEKVAEAIGEKWTDAFGESAAPIPAEAANELAEHISEGNDISITPPER